MSGQPPAAGRLVSGAGRYLKSFCVVLLAALLLLAACYQGLGRILAPKLGGFQAEIEAELGQLLQHQISIGQLQVSWRGWSPLLQASDVVVGDGDSSIELQEIVFQPDLLRSLWGRGWHIGLLNVRGLQLELVQSADGGWQILRRSLQADEQKQAGPFTLAPLGRISSLSLLDGRLRVRPLNGKPFDFNSMNLLMDNRNGQVIQASIELPDRQLLQLQAKGYLDAQNWADTNFSLYLQVPDTDVAPWLPAFWPGLQLDSLHLAGQFWLQVEAGQLAQAQARVSSGSLRSGQLQLQLGRVAANYEQAWQQRRLWFEHLQLGFATEKQLYNWPVLLQQQDYAADGWGVVQLQAARLDIAPVARLLEQFLPNALAREVFATLAPQGQLHNTKVSWQQSAPWEQRLKFDTNLHEVAYSRRKAVPGATGINGRIFGGLAGGELQLDTDNFSLYLAEFFAEPWHYQQARARLTWQLNDEGFRLQSPYLQVRGAEGDIAGDFDIRLFNDPQQEDYMDLRVGMRAGDAAFTPRYLPLVLQHEQPELDQWLRTAIRAGAVHQGYFQYQGSISSATPEQARSISLYFDVDKARLDYQAGWPALTQAQAQVFVHDWGVQVALDSGRVLDSQINRAAAEVIYAPADAVTSLELQAELNTSVADGLYLLQQTPLAQQSTEFASWRGSGRIPASFTLQLPFGQQQPRVRFRAQLDDASLQLADINVELQQLQGRLDYDSASGLSARRIRGSFLQQPFELQLTAKQMGDTWMQQLHADGKMNAQSLAQWLWPQLELPLTGDFAYQALINLDGADSQLVVETDLLGTGLQLPPPLAKQEQQSRPSSWRMSLAGREANMRLVYGNELDFIAALERQTGLLRAQLLFGPGQARLPVKPGLWIDGRLQQLDLQQWWPLLEKVPAQEYGQLPGLQQAKLDLARVVAGPVTLEDARLEFLRQQQTAGWQLQLASNNLNGSLIADQGGELQLSIQDLRLPAAAKEPEQAGPNQEQEPTVLPDWPWQQLAPLQLEVKQLWQGDKQLGRLSARLVQQQQLTGLHDLDVQLHGLQITGALNWQQQENRSRLRGELSGKDIGKILQAWGYVPTLSSEKFSVAVDMAWPGQPQQAALLKLQGQTELSFHNGQLTEVEGGARALRVFGLLNFNSIGRRLRLDFSDLLGKGLSYDRLRGKVTFEQGLLYSSEPLVFKGVSSELNLAGKIDLHTEQIQARLVVAIPISNNLPLAAVLVGAPAIGGALFLVDRLAGNKINRFATVNYHISGDWQKPEISVLENKDENK